MICSKCSEKAVFLEPKLCKKHFIDYFEKKVLDTIKKFKLLNKKDRVVVACSGGKDSTTVLYLLKKFHGNVVALAIDEGIKGYRDKTLVDLKKFCKDNDIKLQIYFFEKEFGKTLDIMLKKKNYPCSVCGTFRRYLLNKCAKGFHKIATGHNMDDEAQAVLMNLLKSNTDLLLHSVPITSKRKGFVQRMKPLYFCSEKEVAAYALLKGFDVGFTECPYMEESFRNVVRNSLNNYEKEKKGSKRNILEKHLKLINDIKISRKSFQYCSICGEPSQSDVCKACELIKSFK
ncbi:TIGR00269 family protein [Candidatus Woesearchaeota archaeon]|nr:TIGR00269 family protein [Candidatus Woesearchaeota archaeon]